MFMSCRGLMREAGLTIQLVRRSIARMSQAKSSRHSLVSLLLLVGVYFSVELLLLGLPLIASSSEAREGQVVEAMRRSGELVLPLRNGIIPSKPPLFHWMGYGASSVLGSVSEFSIRLPTIVFACGVLLCVGVISWRLGELARQIDPTVKVSRGASVAPAILALTYGFHIMSTQAMVDMAYTFFVWAAFCALLCSNALRWSLEERLSPISSFCFWLSVAGAILSRGPVGGVFVVILSAAGGAYVFGLRAVTLALLRPSLGWMCLAAPLSWYWFAYEKGGDAFLARQLLFENMKRVVGGEHINTEAWWFYLPSLLRTTFPWGLVVAGFAVGKLARGRGRLSRPQGGVERIWNLPLVVLCVGVLILSLSSGKRHSYMLPLYPCVALQLGLLIAKALESGRFAIRKRLASGVRVVEIALGVLGIALFCVLGAYMQGALDVGRSDTLVREALRGVVPQVATVLFLTLIPCLLRGERGAAQCARNSALAMFGILATMTCVGSTIKAYAKDFPGMTEAWLRHAEGAQRLVVIKDNFDEYFDPIFFYVRREVEIQDAKSSSIQCEEGVTYLTRRSWLASSQGRLQGEPTDVFVIRERQFQDGVESPKDLVSFRCGQGARTAPKAPFATNGLQDA